MVDGSDVALLPEEEFGGTVASLEEVLNGAAIRASNRRVRNVLVVQSHSRRPTDRRSAAGGPLLPTLRRQKRLHTTRDPCQLRGSRSAATPCWAACHRRLELIGVRFEGTEPVSDCAGEPAGDRKEHLPRFRLVDGDAATVVDHRVPNGDDVDQPCGGRRVLPLGRQCGGNHARQQRAVSFQDC